MHNDTRIKFDEYTARIAELNGVKTTASKFAVVPQVEQKMEQAIRESSGFLQKINIFGVDQSEGEKIGIDAGNTIASRTDTTGTEERKTQDPSELNALRYRTVQTNFDTHLRYNKLDAWRHDPAFQRIVANVVNQQIARDRLMIGWNGTSAALTTNRQSNQKLQDVNIGWLQHQRTNKPASVMNGTKIGDKGDADYKNLDAAVMDATNNLLAEWHSNNPDLVVICGRRLLSDKLVALVEAHEAPTQRNALDIIITNKLIGGLPVVTVPYFPDDAFAVTALKNLSIYYQRGSTRRTILDNPRKDQVEDYRSVNECYVVEDHNLMCVVENIKEPAKSGIGWE